MPVSIDSGQIYKDQRTFSIRCHDRFFRDGVLCDDTGNRLFDCVARNILTSWNLRRHLTDASGQDLLTIRHYNSSLNRWTIEDMHGRALCRVKDVSKQGLTTLDAQVCSDSSDTTIHIKSFDAAGTKTSFEVEGIKIAEMTVTDNNDVSFLGRRGLDRSAWKLEVAGGVDVALVAAIAFVRVEVMHARRR